MKSAILGVLQSEAKEVKKVSTEEYKVWLTSSIDDYLDKIGDAIQEQIYEGTDFDYTNRGDRIDIFPVK